MFNLRRHIGAAICAASIITLLIAEGCASIGNPSGGPRDERPPRFIAANPAPGALDVPVDQERIRITFDELVNVKDAFSKVIVSPPGTSTPRVSSLGKTVTVQFADSLLPNTTYTVDFADAIEDNNEANRLENFAYTFSTGPSIDTLRISGRVLSARALEPMQLKLVGVHRIPDASYPGSEADNDSIRPSDNPADILHSVNRKLFTEKFYRVARTDDRGRFSIEGLPAGQYRIYALDDANSDYLFTNPDEEVGFLDVTLTPSAEETVATDSIFDLKLGRLDTVTQRRRTVFLPNDILIRSFLTARKQQFIQKYERVDTTRINLLFNAPMAAMPEVKVVGLPDGVDWAITEKSVGNDTLSFWIKNPSLIATDTIRLAIAYPMLDSLQRYVEKRDTLRFTADRTRLREAAAKAAKELEKSLKKNARKGKDKKEKDESDVDSITIPIPLLKTEFIAGNIQDPTRALIIQTATPLASLDPAGVRLEIKKDTLWTPGAPPLISIDSLNPRRISVRPEKWEYDTQYRFTVDSLALQGLYGLHNAKIEHEFKTKAEREYCSLTLRLTDWPAGVPAFVELLNASDTPTAVAKVENGSAIFRYLTPGKYYARVIADLNGNALWDAGDPLANLPAEETFYYPKAFNIKQNWNKDESWAVFATAVDLMKPEILLKNKPTQPKNRSNTSKQKEEEDEEEEE